MRPVALSERGRDGAGSKERSGAWAATTASVPAGRARRAALRSCLLRRSPAATRSCRARCLAAAARTAAREMETPASADSAAARARWLVPASRRAATARGSAPVRSFPTRDPSSASLSPTVSRWPAAGARCRCSRDLPGTVAFALPADTRVILGGRTSWALNLLGLTWSRDVSACRCLLEPRQSRPSRRKPRGSR